MNEEIKLSVCIATFNRGRFIGETLQSIIKQATEELEIVVLDGGSKDDTEAVIRAMQTRFSRLRYIRQSVNYGVDKDFDTAVGLARGEYCWLMSDDDLILPGAIAAVMSVLREGHSLVIANAEVRNANMTEVLQRSRLTVDEDRVYGPEAVDQLFVDAGDYLSFIGCVIIKRSIWLQREREQYFGSLFVHVGVIFQKRLPGTARVIAKRLISIRYGNAMWLPRQFEIWMFKWPLLVWSLCVSAAAKERVTSQEPWRRVRTLVLYRALGAYSLNEYRGFLEPRTRSVRERMLPVLVALMPGPVANMVAFAYYRLARSENGMALLNVRGSRYYLGRLWAPKS